MLCLSLPPPPHSISRMFFFLSLLSAPLMSLFIYSLSLSHIHTHIYIYKQLQQCSTLRILWTIYHVVHSAQTWKLQRAIFDVAIFLLLLWCFAFPFHYLFSSEPRPCSGISELVQSSLNKVLYLHFVGWGT